MNRRLARIFGSQDDSMIEQIQQDEAMTAQQPAIKYQQWHENDPERMQEELDLLQQQGIRFECRKMADGRISFLINLGEEQMALICPHLFPIEPIIAMRMNGQIIPSIAADDGKIDLFAHEGFEWTPETHVSDVVARIKTLLSIAGSVKKTTRAKADPAKSCA